MDIGEACKKYHDKHVHGLTCKRIQVDEIWQFCYCKQKNVPAEKKGQFGTGDVWTWVAIDADTKLIVSYLVGLRDGGYATEFMNDVAGRLTHRVQLTSDGLKSYLEAVEDAFGGDVDYAQLVKVYGAARPDHARYSPAVCGEPDDAHVSTSFIEGQNLTMRMSMRRFTRLTNGFSKKVENMENAVALNFMFYNFCRIHKTLRVTPAMEAGLTDHVWEIEELVGLI